MWWKEAREGRGQARNGQMVPGPFQLVQPGSHPEAPGSYQIPTGTRLSPEPDRADSSNAASSSSAAQPEVPVTAQIDGPAALVRQILALGRLPVRRKYPNNEAEARENNLARRLVKAKKKLSPELLEKLQPLESMILTNKLQYT